MEAVSVHLDGRASLGVTGSISVGVVFDFQGGIGLYSSLGVGGGLGIGASVGGGVSLYPAIKSVNDLKGWGASAIVGVDFIAGAEFSVDVALPGSSEDIPAGADGFMDTAEIALSRTGVTGTAGFGLHALIGGEATYTWMKSTTWGEMGGWIKEQFSNTNSIVNDLTSISNGLGNRKTQLNGQIESFNKQLQKAKEIKNIKAVNSLQKRINNVNKALNNLSSTKSNIDNLIEDIKK